MKWILVVTALLAACEAVVQEGDEPTTGVVTPYVGAYSSLRVITDASTGCQYLVVNAYQSSGATPRLDKNGKPMCGAERDGRVDGGR